MPIRAFDWPADLETLESISCESFQYTENPECGMQADNLENMTAELGTIRRMWPLVRAIVKVYPSFIDLVSGFVWEEDGKPGGVNLVFFQLDSNYPELAIFLVGKLVREVMERSPGRRIRFDQEAWGSPLVEAALELGFTLRKEWPDMGMRVT